MPDSVKVSLATPLMIFKYFFLNVKNEFLVGIISKLQKSCLRMYEESHFHYTNLSLQISMVSFTEYWIVEYWKIMNACLDPPCKSCGPVDEFIVQSELSQY